MGGSRSFFFVQLELVTNYIILSLNYKVGTKLCDSQAFWLLSQSEYTGDAIQPGMVDDRTEEGHHPSTLPLPWSVVIDLPQTENFLFCTSYR